MAVRQIRFKDDDILRKISKEVDVIDDKILTLLDDMKETIYNANGVGLEAPQVGILKHIIVLDDGNGLIECINPRIISKGGEQDGVEGCLSVPGFKGEVKRPNEVVVRVLDRNGNEVEYRAREFLARIFCHETDHLDGILYIDKANRVMEDNREYRRSCNRNIIRVQSDKEIYIIKIYYY
ncbi:hypothetical protein PIROE2DRAFT_65337 [Piromyces sp. E2]|nr:hypothetical protein PIROE2DRAFT_65337 [Piromyces sp. E2]|eukprot:OUM56837.1 hypothetical protein PIROE2DRAFT_65337 [Piromyces sp. E2]